MATATRSRASATSRRTTLSTGPWKGVKATVLPFDDAPDFLVQAYNGYIADPVNGSEFVARPGFQVVNPSAPLAEPGQCVFTHLDIDGNPFNFVVSGGSLYRVDADLTTITDVTPAGTPIDPTTRRVYLTSFIGALIVSDGVNKPWVASDFASTPVTKTDIEFNAPMDDWAAYGQPVVYAGSLFFILDFVGTDGRRLDIAWSIPGDPFTGYQQADYDFAWTLEQSGTGPLYGLAATNVALLYWRDGSIGAITGTPGPDLQQTATHDAIAVNVGSLASATFAQYGPTIFFCDVNGRPYRLPIGGSPEPIWLNLRSVIDQSTASYPSATAQVACATIIPGLNLYVAAIWSPLPGIVQSPTVLQIFDTKTGNYQGQWTFVGGASIDAVGILNNTVGRGSFAFLGSKVNGASPDSGYLWVQNTTLGGGAPLTTEGGAFILTEGGAQITVEGSSPSWFDNDDVVPAIGILTERLGYSADVVWNVDSATILTGTPTPCEVTMQTSTTAASTQGTPTPAASQDGTYRLVVGTDVQGRGTQVTVSPTTADTQWVCYSVSILAVPSRATPGEA